MKFTPIIPMLQDQSLRVGDRVGLYRDGGLALREAGVVTAIRNQDIMVYWTETGSNQPVAARILPQMQYLYGRASFEELMGWWAYDTRIISSMTDIMNHPVVALLDEREPTVLIDELLNVLGRENMQTWGILTLLHRLTGEQPFGDEDQGDVEAQIEAWREWRRSKKIVWIVDHVKRLIKKHPPKWMRKTES